jgi:predicted ATPase
MQAYYKVSHSSNPKKSEQCLEAVAITLTYSNQVACKRFIDDVAVEAVETSLLAKLSDILSPLKVTYLAADEVTSVAGESDESRAKRKQLTNQLDVLVHGLETCKKFVVGTLHGMLSASATENHGFIEVTCIS